LSKESGVLLNSLTNQRLQKGINPCKTDWHAIVEEWLDQELNEDEI